eukprot:761420-Hanusia_phi.AAC.1
MEYSRCRAILTMAKLAAPSHFAPLLQLLQDAVSRASAAIKVTSSDPFTYEYPLLVRNSAATKATVGLMLKVRVGFHAHSRPIL